MTTLQNIIVFLWLVPVLGLIVVPLLWYLFSLLNRTAERSRLADIRGYVTAGAPESEKRHLDRVHLEEGRAYVDEESDCCEATVADISRDGICLKNIACKINPETDRLKILFRTRRKDYTLTARPTWKKLTDKGYEIGAAIDETPSEWNTLVDGVARKITPEAA